MKFIVEGMKRPLFVVGNKVDLLIGHKKGGWLTHISDLLRSAFPKNANILHLALISAKTGFGVEEFINKLHNIWQYKGTLSASLLYIKTVKQNVLS